MTTDIRFTYKPNTTYCCLYKIVKLKVYRGIHVREHRRGKQEWTIQRHWQHWAHKTQNEDKLKKKHTTKTKTDEQKGPQQKPGGEPMCSRRVTSSYLF